MNSHGLVCVKEATTVTSPTQTPEGTKASPVPHSTAATPFLANARQRRALLWGIVSTVLSAIGLIGLALFEQYNGMLSELRTDLKHFNETSGEYVKKDKLQQSRDLLKDCFKEIHASNMAREQVVRELNASERAREEMEKEFQRVRERLAFLEGLRSARPRAGSSAPAEKSGQDPAPKHHPPTQKLTRVEQTS